MMKSAFIPLFLAILAYPRETMDRVLAVVGEEIILQSEVLEMDAILKQQQPGWGEMESVDRMTRLVQRLIDEKIILAKAERDTSFQVDEKDIDNRMRNFLNQKYEETGGQDRFELMLQQMGMSIGEFKVNIREQIRQQYLRQRLQEKYVGNVEPSNLQVQKFFKENKDSLPIQRDNYRISHLEMSVDANLGITKKALLRCDSVIQKLNKGEKFEELAKKYSDDPSGEEGGDLGFTKRGTLDPGYEGAAFRLQVGDFTQRAVKSRLGYHIIKLTEKRDIEVKTSHILFLVKPSQEDTVKTRSFLDSLVAKISAGQSEFSEVAKRFSEDKATKDKGGNLGWFNLTSLNPEYREIIRGLEEGGISEPVLVQGKYHVFRLDKKMDERKLNLDDDWSQIAFLSKNHLSNRRLSEFLDKWKTQVYVENRSKPFLENVKELDSPLLGPEENPSTDEPAETIDVSPETAPEDPADEKNSGEE